jgi:hypothetical protein
MGKDHLEGKSGEDNIKMVEDIGCGVDSNWLRIVSMAGYCEYNSELLGNIKSGEILDSVDVASQEGLCCIKLVNNVLQSLCCFPTEQIYHSLDIMETVQ